MSISLSLFQHNLVLTQQKTQTLNRREKTTPSKFLFFKQFRSRSKLSRKKFFRSKKMQNNPNFSEQLEAVSKTQPFHKPLSTNKAFSWLNLKICFEKPKHWPWRASQAIEKTSKINPWKLQSSESQPLKSFENPSKTYFEVQILCKTHFVKRHHKSSKTFIDFEKLPKSSKDA